MLERQPPVSPVMRLGGVKSLAKTAHVVLRVRLSAFTLLLNHLFLLITEIY